MKNIFNLKNSRRLLAVLCFILTLCVVLSLCSCRKNNSDEGIFSSSNNSSDYSSTATYTSNTDTSVDSEGTESSEESQTTDSTSNSSTSTPAQNGGADNTQGGGAVQLETTKNADGKEIMGEGTKDKPYYDTPDVNNMTVTTVNIPAGQSVFYGIYRVGGMILTIENPNAYVVHEGNRYNANGGKVTFTVANALASDAVSFEIGNSGSSAAAFKISFSNVVGSYSNPEKVTKISNKIAKNLAQGADTGYYYTYTAEKTGTIRFYMMYTAESVMNVQNNTGATVLKQFATDSEDLVKDPNGNPLYIEMNVNAGDILLINIAAKQDEEFKYPATKITWYGKYTN